MRVSGGEIALADVCVMFFLGDLDDELALGTVEAYNGWLPELPVVPHIARCEVWAQLVQGVKDLILVDVDRGSTLVVVASL